MICSKDKFRNNNPPLCDCLKGFYEESKSGKCIKCKANCSQCKNENSCDVCNENMEPDNFTG